MTTTALKVHSIGSPIGNLSAYIQRVYQIPILTAKEEKKLANRFLKKNDLGAAQKLVLAHLKFVVKIAKNYMGYGLSLADLIQEGNIGLMKAVKRFDPKKGVRLVSFAIHWIKAEIHEFVLRNYRIVKVATTKAQRKLFFNLRKIRKELGWLRQNEIKDVAKTLNVKEKTVSEMESRLHAHDIAFDGCPDDSDNQFFPSPQQYLYDQSNNPAYIIENENSMQTEKECLYQALEKLDERSQIILRKRYLAEKKATLQSLADQFDVSAERIRQIENEAIKKLKKLIVTLK